MTTTFSDDATPAYRGYRRQALYTLSRLLLPRDAVAQTIQPEGAEDLAVFDDDGQLIEIVQVKDHGNPLTVSTFSPEKRGSFFERAGAALIATPNLTITIASFGAVGQELAQAIAAPGSQRTTVAKKLVSHRRLSTIAIASNLLDHMWIDFVDEAALVAEIDAQLRAALTGVDPEHAFDLLAFWLYTCAEERRMITRADAITKINGVGRFLAERTAHHREWFTTIVPIDADTHSPATAREDLAEEFYRGVATRYEHVLADLDLRRDRQLRTIAEQFATHRIVIVHGASGQGKSTLAYRYLHEQFPAVWRFRVRAVENRQHALSIATALSGHADALGLPLAVYLDVIPSDSGWTELVAQLARHPALRVLVTIREEDWRRASTLQDEPHLGDFELTFAEDEARKLYAALAARETPTSFSDFDDAWQRFGRGGPLLEFIYLVTQGESLRQRLQGQVERLHDEVRAGTRAAAELDLLRLVSVAGAYEARLLARPLIQRLGIVAPARTITLLEREYLLRQSADGTLLQGLHPLRSAILTELFEDPTFAPWPESASECLAFIYPPDSEIFLLCAFSRRLADCDALLAALARYRPTHWASIRGVVRALLWLGLREYVEANRPLLNEAYAELGDSGYVLLDFDIANAVPGSAASVRRVISNALPPAKRQLVERFNERQSDKQEALARARAWLGALDAQPDTPTDVETWAALGEALFWYGRLGVARPADTVLPLAEIDAALDELPLGVVADLVFGLATVLGPAAGAWLNTHREQLQARFRRETQTVIVEDDGEKVAAHFVIELDQLGVTAAPEHNAPFHSTQQPSPDLLHDQALLHIDLLRKLYPDRERYACQGYGHQIWSQPFPHDLDSTRKTDIPRSSLPPTWLTQLNVIFRGLSQRPRRPANWSEYASGVIDLRRQIIRDLLHLEWQINVYFKQRVAMKFVGEGGVIDATIWDQHKKAVSNPPLLPVCALDEWGFFDESSATRPTTRAAEKTQVQPRSWALHRYRPFLTPFQKYTRALANFYEQSFNVLLLNPALGRGAGATQPNGRAQLLARASELGVDVNAPRLSMQNLLEATSNVGAMQRGAQTLLAPFIDHDELVSLERQESIFFARFWSVWYWFAFRPREVIPNAIQELLDRATKILNKRRASLRRAFEKRSTEVETIRILSESVLWNDMPALWIALDSPDPATTLETRTAAIAILRATLGQGDPNGLESVAQRQAWPTCVIVPTVRGKLLDARVWPLQLPTLLGEDGLIWVHDQRQSIPPVVMTALGLKM